MGRKQRIIISITGIAITLFALLGLTYAYYLTNIIGNNNNSLTLVTSDLKLVYGDGNSAINVEVLMPGDDIPVKTFTVKNNGNNRVDDYAVALEDVINTLNRTDDLTYTLTCIEYDENNKNIGSCNGKPTTKYPKENTEIVVNSIDVGHTQEYSLKIEYVNLPDVNQSEDMGSTINGKVQIYGLADTIEIIGEISNAQENDYVQINSEQKISQIINGKYKFVGVKPGVHRLQVKNNITNKNTSKYIAISKGNSASVTTGSIDVNGSSVTGAIISITEYSNNVTIGIDGTTGALTPGKILEDTLPESLITLNALGLTANSGTPDFSKPATTDEGIYSTPDNYGTSYYFRGNVTNNNVLFGKTTIYDEYCFNDVVSVDDSEAEYWMDGPHTEWFNSKEECLNSGYTSCQGYAYSPVCFDSYTACEQTCWSHTFINCDCTGSDGAERNLNWKIIRINGDGSLRIMSTTGILSDSMAENDGFYYGYRSWENEDAVGRVATEEWYRNILLDQYDRYISKNVMFCSDYNYNETFYVENTDGWSAWEETLVEGPYKAVRYDFVNRKNNPSLYCNPSRPGKNHGETQLTVSNGLTYPIGLITADEVVMAGLISGSSNNYLTQKHTGWTMTPAFGIADDSEFIYDFEKVYSFGTELNESLSDYSGPPYDTFNLYPVINLTPETARNLVWDEEKNAYIRKMISFSINNSDYTCPEGMTFQEFIESEYNIDNNMKISYNQISHMEHTGCKMDYGQPNIKGEDIILDNWNYMCVELPEQ